MQEDKKKEENLINPKELYNLCPLCHSKMEIKREINTLNGISMIIPFWKCTGCGQIWFETKDDNATQA